MLSRVNAQAIKQNSWVSPNHYRMVLKVDQKGIHASSTPAAIDINFSEKFGQKKNSGSFEGKR